MLRDMAGREVECQEFHFSAPSVLWTPPLYFTEQNTPQGYGVRQKKGGNALLSHYFSEWDRLIVFGLLPCVALAR